MRTVLKNARLLDNVYLFKPLDVLVQDGLILDVGERLSGEREIDLTGCTLMPGFIDAHVHVAVDHDGFRDAAIRAWAHNGVTTVRELGMLSTQPLPQFRAWLKEHEGSEFARVISAGKYIDVDGGYGCGPDPAFRVGMVIQTPEEAAQAVTYQYEQGCDGIKIGILDTDAPPGTPPGPRPRLTTDMVAAICQRAHVHGMWMTAHLKKAETLEWLMAYGLDDAAHTPVDPIPDRVIQAAAHRGVMFVTTIGNPDRKPPPSVPEHLREGFQARDRANRRGCIANLKKLYEAGCVIAVGTDLIHSDDFRRDACIPIHELTQLIQAGIPFQDVIRCATINGARVCHIDQEEGSITKGKRANLIAVPGEVDESFSALRRVSFVMNRGTVIRWDLPI